MASLNRLTLTNSCFLIHHIWVAINGLQYDFGKTISILKTLNSWNLKHWAVFCIMINVDCTRKKESFLIKRRIRHWNYPDLCLFSKRHVGRIKHWKLATFLKHTSLSSASLVWSSKSLVVTLTAIEKRRQPSQIKNCKCLNIHERAETIKRNKYVPFPSPAIMWIISVSVTKLQFKSSKMLWNFCIPVPITFEFLIL